MGPTSHWHEDTTRPRIETNTMGPLGNGTTTGERLRRWSAGPAGRARTRGGGKGDRPGGPSCQTVGAMGGLNGPKGRWLAH
jgi:hypothetical protein